MDKKFLKRIVAAVLACATISAAAFVGCRPRVNDGGKPDDTTVDGQPDTTDKDSTTTETDTTKPDTTQTTAPTTPVITKASANEFETAYVEWTVKETEGVWFNVYYAAESDGDNWKQLDAPLIRQYKDYFRADTVGLKAGTYKMKVVPVIEGAEVKNSKAIKDGITVKAHDRSGYAFYNGACPGAYNADGTLKKDAIVLYINNDNFNTVKLNTGKGERVGLLSILGEGYQAKNGDTKPLCVRLIGDVHGTADLDIKGLTTQGVTIEGIGNDATANGWGVHLTRSSNVEVRNLGFMNTVGGTLDNIGSESGCTYLWIHNNDLFYGGKGGDSDQAKGDGALDSKGTDYATYSYNHFWDCGKSNLLGNGASEENEAFEGGRTHLSYHHNWYDHSDSRHPRIRSATVHVYNNYFDGNAKYGVGVTRGASAFVEANYFRSTAKMKPMLSSLQGTDIEEGVANGTFSDEDGGLIKAYNNKIVGTDVRLVTYQQNNVDFDCYLASTRDEQVPSSVKAKVGDGTYNNFDTSFNFKTLYKATVEEPEAAKATVQRYAGRLDGGDFKWTFTNADDAAYAVNTQLKTALVGYKTGIVKINGIAVSTGGSTGGGTGEDNPQAPAPIEGSVTIYCNKTDESVTANNITISGNATNKYEVTFGGKTYYPLKMESATSITLTLSGTYTIEMYMTASSGNTPLAAKGIRVNGTKYTSGADGIAKATGITGNVSITKGDSCCLCYVVLTKTA